MHERALTRREFLRLGAGFGAGVALTAPALLTGCIGAPMPGMAALGAPSSDSARVAAARGGDLYELTRRALDTLGGMQRIVAPGETVFIKPNLLTAGLRRTDHTLTGEVAKPEIIITAAEECLRAGAAEVIIGDGAQVAQFDWEELRTLDRATHIAAEAARLNANYDGQVTLACLNSDSPEWDALPARRTNLGEIFVSSLVSRADRIISIPVLKTHRHARLTLSLKNFMGTTPIARYGGGSENVGRSRLHLARGGFEGCFLDIVDALRPDLAIIDASVCCEDYGPWVRGSEGRTVDMRDRLGDWLVLASTDLVAADATAARIVGHEYTSIPHLNHAYEQGLGQARTEMISLEGATLDELRVDWEPA